MDSQDLEKLGLNRNEARVYLGLLHLGNATAAELVKSVGVHRNIVYDNLEKLIEKGLVSFINEGTKRKFIAQPPDAILEFFQARKQTLENEIAHATELLPEIQNILGATKSKQEACLYRGVKSVKKVLSMILEVKEYWAIGVSNASVQLLGETFWKNFNTKIEERKIGEHLLLNADFENIVNLKKSRLRECKVLPAQMTQVTEIMVFEGKAVLIVYSENPLVVLIDDKNVADVFQRQFSVLWAFAKDVTA